MRRFEFNDGKSNKFWEIAVEANTYTVRYGRMGTDGQTSTKVYPTPDKAQAEAEKVIQSKTKKGYAEVAAQAPAAKQGENPELEAAILADRLDRKAWAVYADWLQAEGDARGDLVAVQLALLDKPDDAQLKKREAELLEKNARAWLGEFRPEGPWEGAHEVDWHNGFWQRAKIWVDWDLEEPDFPKMLGVVLRHPSAKFLDTLELGLADNEGENFYQEAMDSLVKHGIRKGLRTLHIGDFEYPDETEISWTEVGSFSKCWTILPDLEDLTITGGSIEIGVPTAPKLKSLKLETGGLPQEPAQQLAKASLPALERLEIWFGTEDYGGSCTAADAAAIASNAKGLPKVKWLGFMNADFANEIPAAIAQTPLLKQVDDLDLSMGTMTDEGAQALLDLAPRFAHLKSLNLDENFITDAMAEKLKAALPMVEIGSQEDPGDWVFVSVGE
ncbi:MAG: WGR domain-containing protein [Alphaproteobacteria bacterium]|nr:WGR domain-containing protein [Alphaproteobacteria bacterium]